MSTKQVAANIVEREGVEGQLPVGVIEVPLRLKKSKREKGREREDIHTLAKFSIGDSIAWNNLLINYNWNE